MFKEVGASGQISLGKKHAGKLYNVITHPDGRFELIPIRVVTATRPATPQFVQVSDGWLPPGGYTDCTEWARDNREALEHYAQQIETEGTAAEQLQQYLAEHPELTGDDHGPV
jgi:hypothetical protein